MDTGIPLPSAIGTAQITVSADAAPATCQHRIAPLQP